MKPLIKLSLILIILTWYLGFVFGALGWCEEDIIIPDNNIEESPYSKGVDNYIRYLDRVKIPEEDIISSVLPIIIQAESSGNPNVIGSAGEIGLYQISPILLKDYNSHLKKNFVKSEYLFRPYVNEMIARWQLNNIINALKKHNLPIDKAHICFGYNSGIGNMIKYPVPRRHKNLIYKKVYTDYYKNKETKK